ncbi:MAG: hypothetical protein IKX13_02785, partial [Bacteroidales bacterium]|nr:hypothetical protein [Bacteroidales bacterium]
MKKLFFFMLSIMILAVTGLKAQTPTTAPVHFFYVIPQQNLQDTAFIADSLYANGNHDSMISIDYKIYRNGVLIDTMSKYGWAYLKLRQAGTEFVADTFHSGIFDFPRDIPFAGMVAHSFSISIINAESGKMLWGKRTLKCNRGRVPMLYMHFNVPGTYSVVAEVYSQKNYTAARIGTIACSKFVDKYSLTGDKRALWTSDTVTFVVKASFSHMDSVNICAGEVYQWRGKKYMSAGTYSDIVHNSNGTDSVYQLKLTLTPAVNDSTIINICSGSTAYWRSKQYTKAGVYRDSVMNKNGCYDRYKLTVRVLPRFMHRDTIWHCKNSPVKWQGLTINGSGYRETHYDAVTYCDSGYSLRLYEYPTYLSKESMVICGTDNYVWHGKQLNQSGVFYDTLQSVHGCDSVFQLTLTVKGGFLQSDTVRVSTMDDYLWRGRKLHNSGVYTDSLKDRFGCDSIYRLVLDYTLNFFAEQKDTICAKQGYVWTGHAVSIGMPAAGTHVYWDSLKTLAGGDSVFKLTLYVMPNYLKESVVSVCDNETYVWKGHAVSIGQKPAGSYVFWDSLHSQYGCDSVFKLTLKVWPSYYSVQKAAVCDNEQYVWQGHSVGIGKKPAGSYVYWDSLKTAKGCDSVFRLDLTVYPSYSFAERADICEQQTYTWKGHAVSIGHKPVGNHVIWDSLKTVDGCDSVYQLNLNVHPNHAYIENVEICDNESYLWKGHAVLIGQQSAGSYIIWDSLKTVGGCDSVYRLNLKVNATFLHADTFEICEGGSHWWRGRQLTASGVFDDSLQTVRGCDSIYRLVLHVRPSYLFEEIVPICNNNYYVWRGRQLSKEGVYTDSLKSVYGCDSVYKLTLRVNPEYLKEDTLEGCEGRQYVWHGRMLSKEGVYMDSLKASMGCDSIFRLVLYMHPASMRTDTVTICG